MTATDPFELGEIALHRPDARSEYRVRILGTSAESARVQFEFDTVEIVPLSTLRHQRDAIANTKFDRQNPWPADAYIQGGGHGVVLGGPDGARETAFVEVFPKGGGFIRGEGRTVPEAEDAAWVKWQRHSACSDHEYEARGYTNGAGFCKHCDQFKSQCFTGAELGQFCVTCGTGTTWARHSDRAVFDPTRVFLPVRDPAPVGERSWYCKEHDPFRADWEILKQWREVLDETNGEATVEAWEAFKASRVAT